MGGKLFGHRLRLSTPFSFFFSRTRTRSSLLALLLSSPHSSSPLPSYLPPQDNQDQIQSEACQDEVFYYELMEVTDFRNDVILAEACRNDVEMYCKDVEPGE